MFVVLCFWGYFWHIFICNESVSFKIQHWHFDMNCMFGWGRPYEKNREITRHRMRNTENEYWCWEGIFLGSKWSKIEQQSARVFDFVFDRLQESYSFSSIDESVIVSQSQVPKNNIARKNSFEVCNFQNGIIYIMGLATIWSFLTTGLLTIECMPRIAD